jgi:hypothetical protein
MFVLRARSVAVVGAVLIGLAAAAGCSSSATSSTPPGTTATATTTVTASASSPAASNTPAVVQQSTPAAGGPAACPTSSLAVKQGGANGYAGGTYEDIQFTNTSSSSCTLFGYPGVSLVSGASHAQIGLAAKRSATVAVKLITLAPGASAHAQLQIVDALNFPSSSCGPAKATDLQVYPPNQKAAVFLPSTASGCSKSEQVLFIGAVQAGA